MLDLLLQRIQQLPGDPEGRIAPGLSLFRKARPTTFDAMVYEPLVCLILQGAKAVSAGDSRAVARAGTCLVVSHATPVVSRVSLAPDGGPYLSLVAHVDLAELRSLYAELGPEADAQAAGGDAGQAATAVAVTPVDAATLDVFTRYVALASAPEDVAVLAPLVRRELHYRLLRSSGGAMLRRLLRRDSHASHVARAIEVLRDGYRDRLEMDEVARGVGMSTSAFYKHFKAITATTPLQYQKDLRLTEARRLLLGGDHTVATAAFSVGYESPSQFSREYARKFGGPPSEDRGPLA